MAGVVVSLAVCLLGLLVVYRCLAAWGLRAPGSLARHAVEEGPPAAQGLQPGWRFSCWALAPGGLLLAGMAAAMLLSDGGLTWERAFQQLQRWDAAHYIRLIEEGYQGYTENGQHLFLVFFPGYVWAARLLRLVIPSTALAGRPSPACATAAPAATSTAWLGRPTTAGGPGRAAVHVPVPLLLFSPAW